MACIVIRCSCKTDLCSSLEVNIVNANTCSAHNLQAALSCLKHFSGDLQNMFDDIQVEAMQKTQSMDHRCNARRTAGIQQGKA